MTTPNLGKLKILTPAPTSEQGRDINFNFRVIAGFIDLTDSRLDTAEAHASNADNPHETTLAQVLSQDNSANSQIKNVADGTDEQDVVTLKQLQNLADEIDIPDIIAQNVNISDLKDVTLSTLAAANILIYNGEGLWANKAMSGDATMTKDGVITIREEFVLLDEMIAYVSAQIEAIPPSGGVDPEAIKTVTSASYTISTSDRNILANASSNAITMSLPSASTATGIRLNIKKIDSTGNAVTINASGSETIDGAGDQSIHAQYVSIGLTSDGSNWYIL